MSNAQDDIINEMLYETWEEQNELIKKLERILYG